jgi:hypothetical protein
VQLDVALLKSSPASDEQVHEAHEQMSNKGLEESTDTESVPFSHELPPIDPDILVQEVSTLRHKSRRISDCRL